MKFISVITPLVALFSAASAIDVRYDTTYDNPQGSLSTVACSDGVNGLLTKGYNTFSDLPFFPYIASGQAVAGWNSPSCGSCWEISYGGESIHVLLIDHAEDGFVLSLEAMNDLTGGNAGQFGTVDAEATPVDSHICGL